MPLRGDLDIAGAVARMLGAAEAGARLGAEHVLQVSRERVPIADDGGTLERSGRASVEVTENGVTAAVSYGFPEDVEVRTSKTGHTTTVSSDKYATVQHERTDFRHAPGRTAKYLEGPLVEERDTVAQIVANAIRAEVEG